MLQRRVVLTQYSFVIAGGVVYCHFVYNNLELDMIITVLNMKTYTNEMNNFNSELAFFTYYIDLSGPFILKGVCYS